MLERLNVVTSYKQRLAELRGRLLGDGPFEALWAVQLPVPIEQVIDWALVDDATEPPQREVSPPTAPPDSRHASWTYYACSPRD